MDKLANRYLMALDAGTGSVRAVIFDLEGHQISSAQKSGRIYLILKFPAQ